MARRGRIGYRLGDRVRAIGLEINTGIPAGTLGRVAEVATGRGSSIYPDPSRRMLFVAWDNGVERGVFLGEVERVRDLSQFAAGSGCYTCRSCGKSTRETGDGEADLELCRACFRESGRENRHNDDHGGKGDPSDCPLCKEEGMTDEWVYGAGARPSPETDNQTSREAAETANPSLEGGGEGSGAPEASDEDVPLRGPTLKDISIGAGEEDPVDCGEGKHEWGERSRVCGVRICYVCGAHEGLARCFCGWNLAPGERLEDDVDE